MVDMSATLIDLDRTKQRYNGLWITFYCQAALIITLNIYVVLQIVLSRKLRQRFHNIFLANLLIVHACEGFLCIGLIVESRICSNVENLKKCERDEKYLEIVFSANTLLSCFSNLPVTMDRLIAIMWPFHYSKLTMPKAIIVSLIPWLAAQVYVAVGLSKGRLSEYEDPATISIILVGILIIVISNALIYYVIRKQTTEIRKNLFRRRKATVDPITSPRLSNDQVIVCTTGNNQRTNLNKRSRKAAFICFGFVVSYVVFWLPHLIFDFLEVSRALTDTELEQLLSKLTIMIAFTNAIVDPVMYVLLNKEIRRRISFQLKTVEETFSRCCQ